MNRRGFTLIELLAVIALLGLISGITVVTAVSYFRNSKEKTENVFKNEITSLVDDFITVNYNKFNYGNCNPVNSNYECATKYKNTFIYKEDMTTKVNKNNENIYLSDLITVGYIDKFINPNNSEVSCDPDSVTITVKRNINTFKYCFITSDIACLTSGNKSINTCEE